VAQFGFGAGIPMGVATGYLFVDGSGVRGGLRTASQAFREFEQQAAKASAAAVAKANAAAAAAKSATFLDAATLSRQAALAANVATATADAQARITKSYGDRESALRRLSSIDAAETAKIIAAKQAAQKAEEALFRKQQEITQQQQVLARARTPQQRQFASAQLNVLLQDEAALISARQAAQNALAATTATAQNRIARATRAASSIVSQANIEQLIATNKARDAVKAQAAEFRTLSAGQGVAAKRAAEAVEAAGLKEIAAIEARIAAEQRLDRARRSRRAAQLGGDATGLAAAVKEEQLAQKALFDAENRTRVATAGRVRAAQNASQVLQSLANADAKAYERAAKAAEAAAARSAAAWGQATAAAEAHLARIGRVVGLGVAAVAAGSVAAFVGLEEQLRNVASISDDVDYVMNEMRAKVESLAVATGLGPVELTKALYDVVSSGFDGAEALGALEATAFGAVAGMSDVATTGKSLTAVINAYSAATGEAALTTDDFQKVSDIAFQGVKDGIFSFEELTQQQGDNLSIAAEMGVTYEELVAAYVVLTRRGNSLAESTTQLNGIMRTLLDPNVELTAALRKYGEEVLHVEGLTGEMLIDLKGFGGALAVVTEITKGNATATAQLFPNVRALRGELGLTSDGLALYNESLANTQAASGGAGATMEAFGQQSQSAAHHLRVAQQTVVVAAADLGEGLAPAVVQVAEAFAGAVGHVSAWDEAMGGVISQGAVFGTTLIFGVAGLVKFVDFVKHTAVALKVMAIRLGQVAAAATLANLALGVGILALAAVAFYFLRANARAKENAAAVRDTAEAYEALFTSINQLLRSGKLSDQQERALGEIREIIEDVVVTSHSASRGLKDILGDFSRLREFAEERGLSVFEAQQAIQAEIDLQLSQEEQKELYSVLNQIIETTDVDLVAVLEKLTEWLAMLESGQIEPDKFLSNVNDMLVNIDQYQKGADEAAASTSKWGQSLKTLSEFFGDADTAADDYRKNLQALTLAALEAEGVFRDDLGVGDTTSALANLVSLIGREGDDAFTILLRAANRGLVVFGQEEKAALAAAAAVEQASAAVAAAKSDFDALSESIAAQEQLLGDLADAIGTPADGYAALDQLVQAGYLTQQQAADVIEAEIFLREHAKTAIAEESAERALSVVELARQVQAEDEAKAHFEGLSEEQRDFANSLKDTTLQTSLLTVVMLKLAEALGAVEQGTALRVAMDISEVSPAFNQLINQTEIFDEPIVIDFDVQSDPTLDTLEAVQQARRQTEAELQFMNTTGGALTDPDRYAALSQRLTELVALEADFADGVVDGAQAVGDFPALDSGIPDSFEETGEAVRDVASYFQTAEEATESFDQSVRSMIDGALADLGGALDVSDPLKFLNDNLGLVDAGLAEILLKGSQRQLIDLTDEQREALRLQANIDSLGRAIAGIDAGIQENNDTIALWTERFDLVSDVFGEATGGFEELGRQLAEGTITFEEYAAAVTSGTIAGGFADLDRLLATGRISQAQYNEIVAAGISIQRRSRSEILDAEAARALALPMLNAYIEAHARESDQVADLSREQQGYLAALQDTAVQTALQTFLTLSLLEALGALPEGVAIEFITNAAAQNPLVDALARDLGAIDNNGEPYRANVEVTTTGEETAGEVQDIIGGVDGQTATATVDLTVQGGDPSAVLAPLQSPELQAQATEAGRLLGQFFDLGVTSGIVADGNLAQINAAAALVPADRGGGLVGRFFDYGVARGIYEYQESPGSAAAYIGKYLVFRAMLAIGARSPARAAFPIGISFNQGVALALYRSASVPAKAAETSARLAGEAYRSEAERQLALAQQVGAGASFFPDRFGGAAGAISPIDRARLEVGIAGRQAAALAPVLAGPQTINVHQEIHDERDPKKTAQAATDQLFGALRRLNAAQGRSPNAVA
jgi:hypothetical protein